MNLIHSEYRDRIDHWIRTLKQDFYMPLEELQFSFAPASGRMTLEEARQMEFHPVSPGFTWGRTWEYGWFCASFTLPEEAMGQRIVLDLHPGGEAVLFVNNCEFGTYRAGGIKTDHHYLVDNFITRNGCPGEEYTLYMEVYAGHYYPEAESGDCAVGPVLPGFYRDPLTEGCRRQLGTSTYGIWDEDAYQLYMDVMTIRGLLKTVDPDSLRAQRLAEGLETFTLCTDFEQEKEARRAGYREARKALAPVLAQENGPTMPVFSCVGNSHLDLVWLWPREETRRKTARTFAAQLRLLEEYPDYYFIQSQPACYELCRQCYPELFERIRQAVKEGRWIAEGAMWVEPDTNMAGGEALIRQLLYGKRYYKEMFDADSRVLWLPDTFGYSAALPQILKGCGVDYLVTQKIFWSYNDGEQFPYHYFSWKGMDGSRITSFLPTSYTYGTDPEELNQVWKKRVQRRNLDSFLIPFGYGDGGGGPTRDHIEYLKRQENLEGGVRVKMESPAAYFERLDQAGGPKDTYAGELYFNAHRGTYTSQAMIKKLNRKAEIALRNLEFWAAAASAVKKQPYPAEETERLWKVLLFNQFHDILPGSSIGRVYEEAEEELREVCKRAGELKQQALAAFAEKGDGLTVCNSLPFARTVFIQLPDGFGTEDMESCTDGAGRLIKIWREENRRSVRLTIPPMGMTVLYPSEAALLTASAALSEAGDLTASAALPDTASPETMAEDTVPAVISMEQGHYVMSNGRLQAEIDPRGELLSFRLLKDGEAQRELAAGPMNHFRLFKDVPRKFDAWDIDSNYESQELQGITEVHTEILSSGGSRAVLRIKGSIGNSSVLQDILLEAGSDRLEFKTEIDWRERHRLLKVSFPTLIQAAQGINEIQFGFLERPMERSNAFEKDRFEVCNHRYSAVCDNGNGFGLLNDCKYGISMKEGALELTLLRAGACPDMTADNRLHSFTYGITAWEGSFRESSVLQQACELNEEPEVIPGIGSELSLFHTDKAHIVIDAVKLAEDGSGDLILRLYEAGRWRDRTRLTAALPVLGAWSCDMLENIREELAADGRSVLLDFRAFEIKTIRLRLRS